MTAVFQTVLNMSITGAFIAAAIMVLRFLLRKLPRKYSYLLWLILAVRLLCPVSFSSELSIFNLMKPKTEENRMIYVQDLAKSRGEEQARRRPQNMMQGAGQDSPAGEVPETTVYKQQPAAAEQTFLTKPETKETAFEIAVRIASGVWIAGVALMLFYTTVSYLRVRRRIFAAEHLKDNIYYCGQIESPFVFGIFRPRIYLPADLPDEEEKYILAHEKVHIRRGDHLVKMTAMFTLCLHWFNPFVWISYKLMMRDMEISCDERALLRFDGDVRGAYARTLLNMSARQNGIVLGGILAFGESNIKMRVKGVLRARKPRLIATAAAVVLIVSASVCLLTNAQKKGSAKEDAAQADGQGGDIAGKDAKGEDGRTQDSDGGADTSGSGEKIVYFGDLDGNGEREYAVLTDVNTIEWDEWSDVLRFYFNGERIYVHEDLLPVSIGGQDAHYLDLDADGEKEILLRMDPYVNSMPLVEYAVLKKDDAGGWRKLEVIEDKDAYSLCNAFPIRFTPASERREMIMTLDGLNGKQCSFDVQTYYEKQKRALLSGEMGEGYGAIVSDYETYLNGEGYREDAPGQVADWGIWELTVNEYGGRPCLVATHGILGYDKADWWGNLDVWFDYDRSGKIRFLDMIFYPERTGEDKQNARAAYAEALRDILRDMEASDADAREEISFAVEDVDKDQEEELIILSDPGIMAGMTGSIIGYDMQSGKLYEQLTEFPGFVFLENGNLKVLMSHNQTRGEMWPYTLYRYVPESDCYVQMGIVYAGDRDVYERTGNVQDYPQWADTSNTGTVYYVGADHWSEDPIDVREYQEWLAQNGGGSREIDVQYQPLTEENIAKMEEVR